MKLQSLKGEVKFKFHKNISDYYDQMKILRKSESFQNKEDPFSKGAQSIGFIFHEALLLLIILPRKPRVKSKKEKHYDL